MKKPALACCLLCACVLPAAAEETVTFTKHVAPILWQSCAVCHHKGEVGPFPLLTYADASKRAGFLRDVTQERRMPPWKAEPNFGVFHGERRLSAAQIDTLARWAAAGAPEGDPKDLPSQPKFPEGWQLGKPDLILKLPAPFTVPAGGPDIWRCFVIPFPIDVDKTVAAIEFHPGNRKVVHHSSLYLDNKGLARAKDGADGKPGYNSFGGPGIKTSGSLGGWTLGDMPRFLPSETGMPVAKGSDLVMQIHYHSSGKDETDQSEVGIFFTSKPARRFVTGLSVKQDQLDIPPGEKRHHVTAQSARLPADVQILSVSPHMHNLGREIKAVAVLPGGETVPLVWLKDWDFNWHEVYHFDKPITLPRGSIVRMEAFFDNSADNPKNPNRPPKRVRWGTQIKDEMCLVQLQVITDSLTGLGQIEEMSGSKPVAPAGK